MYFAMYALCDWASNATAIPKRSAWKGSFRKWLHLFFTEWNGGTRNCIADEENSENSLEKRLRPISKKQQWKTSLQPAEAVTVTTAAEGWKIWKFYQENVYLYFFIVHFKNWYNIIIIMCIFGFCVHLHQTQQKKKCVYEC